MDYKKIFYPENSFGEFTDIDGTVAFYNRVNALITAKSVVLDVGCGRGAYSEDKSLFRKKLRILKGKAAWVIGIDVDEEAKQNPNIDEFHLIQENKWPIDSDRVDMIVCDNVMEHVADPDVFFGEVKRVLRKGGNICIRTSNRWNYFAIAASLIPNRYHAKVTNFAHGKGVRKEKDVFPTLYRCNSVFKLRKILKKFGFQGIAYGYDAEPSYLSFSIVAYLFGVLHQKFALNIFKSSIFVFGVIQKDD